MQALLEVKEGELPYKAAVSEWFCDEDGPLCFRIISKKRLDDQIEMVCYTLRNDGLKRVISHISFAEDDFYKIISSTEEAFKKFFPDLKFDIENIDVESGSNCRIAKNNKISVLKLWFINWLECKINGLKTKIKK